MRMFCKASLVGGGVVVVVVVVVGGGEGVSGGEKSKLTDYTCPRP